MSSAQALGVVRAIVSGVLLALVLRDSFLRDSFSMSFKLALSAALFASFAGWWTPVSTKLAAALVVLYEGLLVSSGHFDPHFHPDETAAVTILAMLAFTPCGDGFSIDALAAPPRRPPRGSYRYPVWLAQGILACSGLINVALLVAFNRPLHMQWAMYLIFVLWVGMGRRLRYLLPRRRPVFPPEFFPGARFPSPDPQGLLLWDGDCGFCKRMATLFQKIALRPVLTRPFQEVAAQLPRGVLAWTGRQMHWVRPDGSMVGGSQALIEALAAAGRNVISGALGSMPLRPFTWMAYRLVAANRGVAGKAIGANCELPR